MRSHSSFIGFLNNVISGAHLAFSCYESLVPLDPKELPLSLVFMTLTILKITGLLICRMSLCSSLSDVCS